MNKRQGKNTSEMSQHKNNFEILKWRIINMILSDGIIGEDPGIQEQIAGDFLEMNNFPLANKPN